MKPDMNKDFLRVRLRPPILIGNVTDIFQRTTFLDCISALLYLLSNMVIFFLNTQEALVADTGGGILASGGTFTLYICTLISAQWLNYFFSTETRFVHKDIWVLRFLSLYNFISLTCTEYILH